MSIDLANLKQLQQNLAKQIVLEDNLAAKIQLIGGADVGFENQGTVTRAAVVILSYPDFQVIDYQIARIKTEFPYIPGYLSFREYKAVLAAFDKLRYQPDLLMVDGQGVAHPRRLGNASHLGLLLDIPTIGVAKRKLYGDFKPLEKIAGNVSPLMVNNELIGHVYYSKNNCNPLFISSGHKISQNTALNWVKNCVARYRLPEPTRFADAIASNKPFAKTLNINL